MHPGDASLLFLREQQERVVAESGCSGDRYHVGKLILQSLRDDPEYIVQIDAASDAAESGASVLARSVRCARGMERLGCGVGDVLVTLAPNHNELYVAVFAALYRGVAVAAVDRTSSVESLQSHFDLRQPKLVMCQSEKVADVQEALENIHLDAKVISFDEHDAENVSSFKQLLDLGDDIAPEDFKASHFDPEETACFLTGTSGTTGNPKAVATTHKNVIFTGPYTWASYPQHPSRSHPMLMVAPLEWVSTAVPALLSAVFRVTRLHTSRPATVPEWHRMINRYRPGYVVSSTSVVTALTSRPGRDACDLSCFKVIWIGGNAVPTTMLEELKELIPGVHAFNAYGMTECTGAVLSSESGAPAGSSGRPLPCLHYRLVDVETGKDVIEPHQHGELWLKGAGIVKGYIKNEEATKESFVDGGWYRTGDIFYKDENNFYFFVERIKLLLKTFEIVDGKLKGVTVSPVEVERAIRRHAGVQDVAVTGVPDRARESLLVACVVPRAGHSVTAQEVKDLVDESLDRSKRLTGGVIYLKELPMTTTSKLDRRKVQEIAIQMIRQE